MRGLARFAGRIPFARGGALGYLAPRAALLGLLLAAGPLPSAQPAPPRLAQVIVVLADNEHQGIVPVPAELGNGLDKDRNLYWGARYGLRTFFRDAGWKVVWRERPAQGEVLERLLLSGPWRDAPILVLAEAWRGDRMPAALSTGLAWLAGRGPARSAPGPDGAPIAFGAAAGLVAFVGHDGLMDAPLQEPPAWRPGSGVREAVIIACASKAYFAGPLEAAGARPLVWTTGLLAAEAYSLEAALEGWARAEPTRAVRARAARAYARYQRCSEAAARRLFDVSGR
ncbi:MAG TPA: hypothetical protein P5076_21940 [Myxococcota bacterium]|nr:hypothetical protein [Myxococcota bacterium]